MKKNLLPFFFCVMAFMAYSQRSMSKHSSSKYPISISELKVFKAKYNATTFFKTKKKWINEYSTVGWEDQTIKFNCKSSYYNYNMGTLLFKGKTYNYFGKNNMAAVWGLNKKRTKLEFKGIIKWAKNKPIIKGSTIIDMHFYTDNETYHFNSAVLSK